MMRLLKAAGHGQVTDAIVPGHNKARIEGGEGGSHRGIVSIGTDKVKTRGERYLAPVEGMFTRPATHS